MDTLNFNTWTLPRGVQPLNLTSNYTVAVGVIKRGAMLQGGGAQAFAHRRVTDDDLDQLGEFANVSRDLACHGRLGA